MAIELPDGSNSKYEFKVLEGSRTVPSGANNINFCQKIYNKRGIDMDPMPTLESDTSPWPLILYFLATLSTALPTAHSYHKQ